MSLLGALGEVRQSCAFEVVVGHVNHGLRPESAGEEAFVVQQARLRGLECLTRRLAPRPQGENLEAWARRERYRALEEMRKEARCELVLTAHHRRDQAETLLMRILSGRALTDAHGVADYCSERRLLRPLLSVSRAEIEEFARSRSIEFVEDASNSDLSRTRNYLRLSLMPALRREINPALDQTLAELAGRLSKDEDCLESTAEEIVQGLPLYPPAAELRGLPDALRWRVCRKLAIRAFGEDARVLGYRAFCTVEAALLRGSGGGDLGNGISCLVNQGRLVFGRTRAERLLLEPQQLEVPGAVTRHYPDGSQVQIVARVCGGGSPARQSPGGLEEVFDLERIFPQSGASKLGGRLLVRERRDGDYLKIPQRGRRKLKKLFQEQGVIVTLRDKIPVVEHGEGILWVPGVARSDFAPVGAHTRKTLVLEYRHHGPFSNL